MLCMNIEKLEMITVLIEFLLTVDFIHVQMDATMKCWVPAKQNISKKKNFLFFFFFFFLFFLQGKKCHH
jgi:hypothetical protein